MKLNSTIGRYIFKELLAPFGLNVLLFTFVFLMAGMLQITNWIVNYNISILTVLWLMVLSTPLYLVFVLPMSVMMSVLLTFLRLSSDNEIVALKSSGLSLWGLLPAVVAFCLMGFLLTAFMTVYGVPWGKLLTKKTMFRVAAANVDIGLKERTFNDRFKGVMLYVSAVDAQTNTLKDVFIEDKRKPDLVTTVLAPRGRLYSEPQELVVHLKLYNGSIHQTNLKQKSSSAMHFKTYVLNLDLGKALAQVQERTKDRDEMTLGELRKYIATLPHNSNGYTKALIEWHRKFSIPAACFVLGLLAVPLGLQSRTARRSFGLILGFFFFLLYYLLLTAGTVAGKMGGLPPLVGMWLPNFVMAVIAAYLLVRTAGDRPPKISRLLGRLSERVSRSGD